MDKVHEIKVFSSKKSSVFSAHAVIIATVMELVNRNKKGTSKLAMRLFSSDTLQASLLEMRIKIHLFDQMLTACRSSVLWV